VQEQIQAIQENAYAIDQIISLMSQLGEDENVEIDRELDRLAEASDVEPLSDEVQDEEVTKPAREPRKKEAAYAR